MFQRMDWGRFEESIKTESRFFSRRAAHDLKSIFDGIDELQTSDGRQLVVDAGPGAAFHALYRARIFQSDEKLETAIVRPDIHFGPPPALMAAAGRMNARGISVLYGASSQKVAIAELRPSVATLVAVAQFQIIKRLRFLDLTVLSNVRAPENLADFGLAERMEDAVFLRSLSDRITRPMMPDDDPFDYLATQAIADFLATEAAAPIDGIMFPSRQAVGDAFNVVVFQKAARVEPLDIPEGAKITASTGRWVEEGWVDDFEVLEEVPYSLNELDSGQEARGSNPPLIAEVIPFDQQEIDWRDVSLRFMPESLEVHRVSHVEIATRKYLVKRDRRE